MEENDDFYKQFNAEADAYQEEYKKAEHQKRVAAFLEMLKCAAGEDGATPMDDDWLASISPVVDLSDLPTVSSYPKWAYVEDNHPRLKKIPHAERQMLAKQAYPGESWSELLYRLGVSNKGS